jgi:hypothetical protein
MCNNEYDNNEVNINSHRCKSRCDKCNKITHSIANKKYRDNNKDKIRLQKQEYYNKNMEVFINNINKSSGLTEEGIINTNLLYGSWKEKYNIYIQTIKLDDNDYNRHQRLSPIINSKNLSVIKKQSLMDSKRIIPDNFIAVKCHMCNKYMIPHEKSKKIRTDRCTSCNSSLNKQRQINKTAIL